MIAEKGASQQGRGDSQKRLRGQIPGTKKPTLARRSFCSPPAGKPAVKVDVFNSIPPYSDSDFPVNEFLRPEFCG
jgi:hypothetical protein